MDKRTFENADPILDELDEAITKILTSAEAEELRQLLFRLNEAVGKEYVVSLTANVDIFDDKKDRCLPLLQGGLSGFNTKDIHEIHGDSSPHSYIVDGEMLTVPHDRCPRCWNDWDFKFQHPTCDHCGATMGKDVKLLLDNDVCPYCDEGEVSMSSPTCDKCGYVVDLNQVVWG